MSSFCILVSGSPTTSQAHLSALRFVDAALAQGHQIKNIFFYQEAVHIANRFICKPTDEAQLSERWIDISIKHAIELQICVAAGNRRGVLSREEAEINRISGDSLNQAFTILGLGQLAAALNDSYSKFIQFK